MSEETPSSHSPWEDEINKLPTEDLGISPDEETQLLEQVTESDQPLIQEFFKIIKIVSNPGVDLVRFFDLNMRLSTIIEHFQTTNPEVSQRLDQRATHSREQVSDHLDELVNESGEGLAAEMELLKLIAMAGEHIYASLGRQEVPDLKKQHLDWIMAEVRPIFSEYLKTEKPEVSAIRYDDKFWQSQYGQRILEVNKRLMAEFGFFE